MQATASESPQTPGIVRLLRRARPGEILFTCSSRRFRAVGAAAGGAHGLAAPLRVARITQHFRPGLPDANKWDPVSRTFGAAPAIYGTLVSSIIAIVLAVPISLGAAIYLSEMAPPWLRHPASFLVESLAAIPSVVFGLWGIYVLVPWICTAGRRRFWRPPRASCRCSAGPPFGVGMLAAGVILAIMILPIITAIARDSLLAVPSSQREAMLALGATKWEMISRAVLQYCRSGLVGAVLLGLGRALGETMAVTMVIGKTYDINDFAVRAGNHGRQPDRQRVRRRELQPLPVGAHGAGADSSGRHVARERRRKAAGVADSPLSGGDTGMSAITYARRRWTNNVMLGLCTASAAVAIGVLALILGHVVVKGISLHQLRILHATAKTGG